MLKNCKIHGLTDFSRASRCKKCAVISVDKRRKKIKNFAVEYCGGKCYDCGKIYPNAVYDFHHLDESIKDFGIGSKGYTRSWDKIKKELEKCVMLCANCHRMRHNH